MSEATKCDLCDWESGDNLESLHALVAHMEDSHKDEIGKVISFHPNKPEFFSFYEVTDTDGVATWGGADPSEAVQWLRRSPVGSRLLVSGWDSDTEDAHLVGAPLDITKVVYATLAGVL